MTYEEAKQTIARTSYPADSQKPATSIGLNLPSDSVVWQWKFAFRNGSVSEKSFMSGSFTINT